MSLSQPFQDDSVYSILDPVLELYRTQRKSDQTADFEHYLDQVEEDLSDVLLVEMIRIDLETIHENETDGQINAYCERFPHIANDIRQLRPHPAAANNDVSVPTTIGDYELIEPIGQGGMGIVWRARQGSPIVRDVAIKLMHESCVAEQLIARFQAERQALGLMDHPYIAKVFDAGELPSGRPYYVMELLDGVSLTEYCHRQRLDIKDRVRLFIRICHAITHAHQKAVIHRDLKPSNIVIVQHQRSATPRIIDFGLAKSVGMTLVERGDVTEVGARLGTLKYMSPEQVEGDPSIDTRTDIYSLGVVLYELFTGMTPLEALGLRDMSISEVESAIGKVDPPIPSRLVRSPAWNPQTHVEDADALTTTLRGDLDAIAMKSLEKDRNQRYRSVAEFADDLQRYLDDEVIVARPSSILDRCRRFARRNRAVVATTVGILAILVATSLFSTLQLARANSAIGTRDIALTAKTNALQAKDAALRSESRARELADLRWQDAEASMSFVTQMLAYASPEESELRDVTLREAIDRAAATIDAMPELHSKPLVEARLRQTLGIVYTELTEFSSAQLHLDRALALLKKHTDPSDKLLLKTAQSVGELYRRKGNYEQAAVQLESLYQLQSRQAETSNEDLVATVSSLSALYADIGRYEDALELLHKTKNAIQDDEDFALRLPPLVNNEGLVYAKTGQAGEAIKIYTGYLSSTNYEINERHPDVMFMRGNLAYAQITNGRLHDAEITLGKLIEIQKDVLGESNAEYLRSQLNLIAVRDELGEADVTEDLEDLLSKTLAATGSGSPGTLAVRSNLGNRYLEQNRIDDARRELTSVLDLRRLARGDDDPMVAKSMHFLGNLEDGAGNYAAAQQWYEQASAIYARLFQSDTEDTLDLLLSKANLAGSTRDYPTAEKLLQEVAVRATELKSADDNLTLRARYCLGEVYLSMHRWKEAAAVLEDVVVRQTRTLPEDAPTTVRSLAKLAFAYRYFDFERSKDLADRLLTAANNLPRAHPSRMTALETVAAIFSGIDGRIDESISLASEAYEIQRETIGESQNSTLRTLNLLAQSLAQAGRHEQAAERLRNLVVGAKKLQSTPSSTIENFERRYFEQLRLLARQSLEAEDWATAESAAGKWLAGELYTAHEHRYEVLSEYVESLDHQNRHDEAELAVRSRVDNLLDRRENDSRDVAESIERLYGILIDRATTSSEEAHAAQLSLELSCILDDLASPNE